MLWLWRPRRLVCHGSMAATSAFCASTRLSRQAQILT